jgi:hypothetical protein
MEMIKPAYLATITLIGALSLNGGAFAAEPREVTWDDLVPAEAEFDDAFTRLDEDTLFELSMVANVRDRIESGQEVDEKTLASYRERVETLEAKERVAKTYLANEELDGKPVRIPGYLLPLEFDGDKVSEFLLVPYVGACIHTPPVWVNGLMKAEQVQSSLSFVDGASDIPSAYALEAISVEPYE